MSREWKERIKKAIVSQRKQERQLAKEKRKKSSSDDSVPSDPDEFSALWQGKRIKVLEKYRKKDAKEEAKESIKERRLLRQNQIRKARQLAKYALPGTRPNLFLEPEKGRKKHQKRAHSYSTDTDETTQDDSTDNDRGSNSTRYNRILKNMEKIFYNMAFCNDYDFDFSFFGMRLNLEFLDLEGALYSKWTQSLKQAIGPLEGDPFGKLILAPEECQNPKLLPFEHLDCVHQSSHGSMVTLPPGHYMGEAERVKASITIPNYGVLPQVLDQFIFRQGLCVAVRPSFVTVGLAVPGKKKSTPFKMDLLIELPNLPIETGYFLDPCHQTVACSPKPSTDLFSGLVRQTIKKGRGKTTSPSTPETTSERYWNNRPFHSSQSLIISFRFKFTHLGKYFSNRRCGPEKPGWGVILHKGKPPIMTKRTDYGYVGLRGSIGIICDPIKRTLSIHRDGDHHPLMVKDAPAFPSNMEDGWNTVQIHHRPYEKTIIVVVASELEPDVKYVSPFPVNVREVLGDLNQMYIGFSAATANYSTPSFDKVTILAPLPSLPQTKVFFTGLYSTQPHERGHFILQLHDSCDRIIPLSPAGLSIQLKRIPSKPPSTASHSSDSIAAHPDHQPVRCKVIPRPEQSLYEIYYRPTLPGRYRIYAALGKNPKEVRGNDHFVRKWHKIKNQHVYVRGLW